MRITARELNRSTLGRQLLLEQAPLGVADAVRRLVALQAQQAASPYLVLWTRLTDFDPGDLDAAFAGHELASEGNANADHAARGPRRGLSGLPRGHGADTACRQTQRQPLPGVRTHRRRCPRPDPGPAHVHRPASDQRRLRGLARAATGCYEARRVVGLAAVCSIGACPHRGAVVVRIPPGVRRGRSRPALAEVDASAASLQIFIKRYLEGFGPASMADVAQFAMVYRPLVEEALRALSGELERLEGPDGKELFDIPGVLRPNEDTPEPPRLMAMWDSVLLAYADRSRVISPEYRKLVTRSNGDVLPTVLVDGYVAGVWRSVEGGIEATAFHRLPEEVWEGLAAEARSLVAFLTDREPMVYRRYDHCWSKLPSPDARLLPGD